MEKSSDLKTAETLGLVSLISSICVIILGFLGSITGIICGHIAMKKFNNLGVTEGKGQAKAGLIIGYIGLSLNILAIIAFISFFVVAGGAAAIEEIQTLQDIQ